jgi:hypothetical protein
MQDGSAYKQIFAAYLAFLEYVNNMFFVHLPAFSGTFRFKEYHHNEENCYSYCLCSRPGGSTYSDQLYERLTGVSHHQQLWIANSALWPARHNPLPATVTQSAHDQGGN